MIPLSPKGPGSVNQMLHSIYWQLAMCKSQVQNINLTPAPWNLLPRPVTHTTGLCPIWTDTLTQTSICKWTSLPEHSLREIKQPVAGYMTNQSSKVHRRSRSTTWVNGCECINSRHLEHHWGPSTFSGIKRGTSFNVDKWGVKLLQAESSADSNSTRQRFISHVSTSNLTDTHIQWVRKKHNRVSAVCFHSIQPCLRASLLVTERHQEPLKE